jgi:cytochrome c biogenesis protein ResB
VRLTLLEFKKTDYAGTSMAKSYESRVRIEANGLRREAIISMNRPLRLGSYTFYQQSYAQDGDTYSSTFAVVKNPARNLPAVAGVVIAVGFLLHFMFKLITSMARARRAEQPHVV